MMFRPMPVLTLAAIPALALLLGLGVWQTQRAGWKAEQIAELERRAAAAPAALSAALCREDPSGPVSVDLIMGPDPIRIYGAGPQGQPGWLIVQAAWAAPCDPVTGEAAAPAPDRRVLVQTAFETLNGERTEAPQTLSLEPWPEIGPFTPDNAPERGEYFRLDQSIAAAAGAAPGALVPLWARWDTRSPVERVSIAPADHAGYALTWFGLAAALIAVYLALHHRLGRLRFSRER